MSAPLRILFVNRMAAMVRGGGETFDLEMARHLAALGCEVTFLTGIPVFGRARLGPDDWWGAAVAHGQSAIGNRQSKIATRHLRTPYLGWFPWDKVRGGWRVRWADFVWFEKAAARWAWKRRAQFDVIQVCELVTFVDEFKKRSSGFRVQCSGSVPPVVMRLTAPDFHDPHGALRAADAVIASGTTMKKVRAGPRTDCHNIPNGVDTTVFRPHATDFRAAQGWGADELVIVSVARFQTVKNHAMLVEAFRRVLAEEPRARLALAGSGPLEADVRAACAAAGVASRVSFLGEMPFHRVADLYAASDIAVVSSEYESFSFVALEAMASALPLVVTATEWVPGLIGLPIGDCRMSTGDSSEQSEIENRQSAMLQAPGGVVVPVGDAESFAGGLLQLLRDAEARHRMGAWNRDRVVREFGWTASAAKLLAVYRDLVKHS